MKALHAALILPALAVANERQFTYVYQTATMPVGQSELEVWNTVRAGGQSFTSILDQRLEFETGVGPSTQAALYLNSSSSRTRAGSANELKGFSLEVKHQFTDPAADAFGSGGYLEVGVQSNEIELEGKLLLDKKVDRLTFALNAIAEGEWEWETPVGQEAELELEGVPLELSFGAAYSISPRLSLGLEGRFLTEYEKETKAGEEEWELEGNALFLGPTLSFGGQSWWSAVSVLPQLTDDLENHQSIEIRLLAGLHL